MSLELDQVLLIEILKFKMLWQFSYMEIENTKYFVHHLFPHTAVLKHCIQHGMLRNTVWMDLPNNCNE